LEFIHLVIQVDYILLSICSCCLDEQGFDFNFSWFIGYTVTVREDTEFVPDNENSTRYNGVEVLNSSSDPYDSRLTMAAILMDHK